MVQVRCAVLRRAVLQPAAPVLYVLCCRGVRRVCALGVAAGGLAFEKRQWQRAEARGRA